MRLEGALVELLRLFRHGQGIHLHVRAGAFNAGLAFEAGTLGADVDGDIFHLCIALGHNGIELKGNSLFVPVLDDLAEDMSARAGVDVGDGDVERLVGLGLGKEEVDHGDVRVVFGDDQGVGEDGCAFSACPVVVDDRVGDLDTLGHVEQTARLDGGGVQTEELLRAELGRFLEEVLLHQFGVLLDGLGDRQVDDALSDELSAHTLEPGRCVVHKDGTSCAGGDKDRALGERVERRCGGCFDRVEVVDTQLAHAGEAPGFIPSGRQRQVVELIQPGGAALGQPCRFLGRNGCSWIFQSGGHYKVF